MKKEIKKTGKADTSELRRRAEGLYRKRPGKDSGKLSGDQARNLLHELGVHQIELEMQNEELRRAQVDIEESRMKYSDLYDFAPVGYVTMDSKGKVLEANLTACSKLGTERGLLIGMPLISFIRKEDTDLFFRHIKAVFEEDARQSAELRLKPRKDNVFHALLNSIPWQNPEGQELCRTSIIDITALKLAEEALKASLEEKEVLLREIHHRVKNNLAVISGLLTIQAHHIKDRKYKAMLEDSKRRIRSMSLVHEKIYRSDNIASIDMKEYIGSLSDELFRTYKIKSDSVILNMDVDKVSFNADLAIPCALIINELISNALKYAFSDEKKGEIKVSLRPVTKKTFELTVGDNGVGLPKELEFGKMHSMGLNLVKILAEKQLRGEVRVQRGRGRERGTKFTVRFQSE